MWVHTNTSPRQSLGWTTLFCPWICSNLTIMPDLSNGVWVEKIGPNYSRILLNAIKPHHCYISLIILQCKQFPPRRQLHRDQGTLWNFSISSTALLDRKAPEEVGSASSWSLSYFDWETRGLKNYDTNKRHKITLLWYVLFYYYSDVAYSTLLWV